MSCTLEAWMKKAVVEWLQVSPLKLDHGKITLNATLRDVMNNTKKNNT